MGRIIWEAPIKTVSEANSSEHWLKKARRHTLQQMIVSSLFKTLSSPIRLPCVVKMIRLSPRSLDKDDNLRISLKWIKDKISECLTPQDRKFYIDKKGKVRELKGRCDDNPLITWEYDQEKSRTLGVRIEITYDATNSNK